MNKNLRRTAPRTSAITFIFDPTGVCKASFERAAMKLSASAAHYLIVTSFSTSSE